MRTFVVLVAVAGGIAVITALLHPALLWLAPIGVLAVLLSALTAALTVLVPRS